MEATPDIRQKSSHCKEVEQISIESRAKRPGLLDSPIVPSKLARTVLTKLQSQDDELGFNVLCWGTSHIDHSPASIQMKSFLLISMLYSDVWTG
jgi:hypothetical protein